MNCALVSLVSPVLHLELVVEVFVSLLFLSRGRQELQQNDLSLVFSLELGNYIPDLKNTSFRVDLKKPQAI